MAMDKLPGLLVAKFNRIGSAYAFINEIADMHAQVIELVPTATGSNVIVAVEAEEHVMQVFQKLTEFDSLEASKKFFNFPEQILQRYLSTDLDDPEDAIWIAEGSFVGDLFEVALELFENDMAILDFRMLRNGGQDKSYLICSAKDADEAKLTKLASDSMKSVSWTMISKASESLKSWFLIEG